MPFELQSGTENTHAHLVDSAISQFEAVKGSDDRLRRLRDRSARVVVALCATTQKHAKNE